MGSSAVAADPAFSISERDFAGDDAPHPRSEAFDPERPFLFDGLSPRFATRRVASVFIPMRDGVRLSTDFYLPVGAKLPLPVILSRTPYGKDRPSPLMSIFPEQGFIMAVQDVRGRFESEGEFIANSGMDREDGYDTVTWLAAQPWCNGAIGAIGSSYVGETAAKLAAMRHPNHRASIIMFDGANAEGVNQCGAFIQDGVTLLRALFEWFREAVPKFSYGPPSFVDRAAWFRSPGARAYSTQPSAQPPVDEARQLKSLPVFSMLDRTGAAPSDFAEWMLAARNPSAPIFKNMGFLTSKDRFDAPAMFVTGPQEQGGGGLANFRLFRRNSLSERSRRNQLLLFTPVPHSAYAKSSTHSTWGARDFGDTRFPYYRTFVEWFGHWLREDKNEVEQWPKVRFFVAGRNNWDSAPDWPPPDVADVKLNLTGGDDRLSGGLSAAPPKDHPPGVFVYDPGDPMPSELPGSDLQFVGSYSDRRPLESRGDILAYTTAPFRGDVEITGPVRAVLSVSSTARDTDFAAVLCEVDRDDRVINITHGIARARYREGLDRKVWLAPDRVATVNIDLWHACINIPAGHRLRLHVSSAHFPHFDRNLNTGGDNYTETKWVTATNSIHYGPARPSYLVLPVRRRSQRSFV